MESSRRDLFIDIVVERFMFTNNKMTLFPCFTFITKVGEGVPQGLVFTASD